MNMRVTGNTPSYSYQNPDGTAPAAEYKATGNQNLDQWGDAINKAASVTGLDPNLIGGQIWAESRGDPNSVSTNADGTQDLGLTQIGQERWLRDIVPNLTPEERAKIEEVTGKKPEELDMNNPEENVIGGAMELKQRIEEQGSVEAGLQYYVSGGDPSIGSPTYVEDVLNFQQILASGGQLPP
jgi:hypothetical protein